MLYKHIYYRITTSSRAPNFSERKIIVTVSSPPSNMLLNVEGKRSFSANLKNIND